MLTRRLLRREEGGSASAAANARLVQSRHAFSGQPATPRTTSKRSPPPPAPPHPAASPSSPASLACPAPHHPGSSSPAASPLSAPPIPSPQQQLGRPMFRINNTAAGIHHRGTGAAPPGLEQRLTARPTPHSPALPHPSLPAPPARPGLPGQAGPPRCGARHQATRSPHHIPFRPTHPALPSSPRPNSGA